MQPFSTHARFFSSLKQVEERLAWEKNQESVNKLSSHGSPSQDSRPNSLTSPIYLAYPNSHLQDSSGPALDFLSPSQNPKEKEQEQENQDEIKDLIALLGLSLGEQGPTKGEKEKRLDGWIEYYYQIRSKESKSEPARLACLLLAKASCFDSDYEFPDCVKEFLELEPPETDKE